MTVEEQNTADEPPVEADLAQMASDIADLAVAFEQQDERVNDHEESIRDLEGALGRLVDTLEAAGAGGPYMWRDLDRDATRALWERLADFVTWLHDTYSANLSGDVLNIPGCWFRHPVAVELFTALMVAHARAYNPRAAAPSFDLVEWHTRCMVPTFDLISHWKIFKGCDDGHRESPARAPLNAEGLAGHIAAAAAAARTPNEE